MTAARLPQIVRTLAEVAILDRAARRHALPLADGHMVWRSWGEGEPVLLLHGGSGSWTHWVRTIVPLVETGRQVWIPDLPGFGESAAVVPGGGDADRLPEPMRAALGVLLGDAPVDVVGFSFGTMVGALLAEGWPGRVRRLVLTGAPALGVRNPAAIELRPADTPELLIRMEEVSGWSARQLRDMMGDRRAKFRFEQVRNSPVGEIISEIYALADAKKTL